MRSGRSLLVLLVLAAGLGAYIYFVESKREVGDTAETREKVFTVAPGTIEEIVIRSSGGEVTTLKKSGDVWSLLSPIATTADQSTAGSLATTLEGLEIQKVLEENPTSLDGYGLAPPRFSVSFKVAGDATARQLNVGRKTPTGSDAYAQVQGQTKLFLISGFLEDSLDRTAFDLRDKSLLSFNRDNVDTITMERPGAASMVLARKGSDWRLAQPVDAKADFNSVDALVGRVSSAQMSAIVAGEQAAPTPAELRTFGLDRPRLIATFGAGSSHAALALGAAKDGQIYARDLSRPLVFTVEETLLTDLSKNPDEIRSKDVFSFNAFSAVGLDVTHGGVASSFAKTKPAGGDAAAADVWKATKPQAKDVNQTAMTDFLNTLSSIRATSFADRPAASGEDLVIVARSGEAQNPVEDRVTLRKAGEVVYAMRSGEPGAAVVPSADFDKAVTQFKTLSAGQ